MKIPGISLLREKKRQFKGVAFAQGATVIKAQYKKANNNFEVLAMGLKSGMAIEKVANSSKKFYKDNKRDWEKYSDGGCEELDFLEEVFKRVNGGVYLKTDGIWLEENFLPFLEKMTDSAKAHWLKKFV